MSSALIILADGPSDELVAHLGPNAAGLYARLLGDTALVARQILGARVVVRHSPTAPAALLAGLPQGIELVPGGVGGAEAVASALADGLADGGPAIVLGGDLPHLPVWRLRDALTHLGGAAEVVVGPADSGSWYLIGLRAAATALLGKLPARGAPLGGLRAAEVGGHVVHLLPPWFGIATVGDLAALADTLRTMPRSVATATRALFEASQASRAVGG